MDIFQDAMKFKKLSERYRIEVQKSGDGLSIMKDIKNLVEFTAERVGRIFRIQLEERTACFEKGKGIPMIGMSVPTIIAKKNSLKFKDLTTFNPIGKKKLHGLNIILDYSGSMWFKEKIHTIDSLNRIYAQNFLALVLGVYIQKISKGEMKIAYTPFSETGITEIYSDFIGADWDLFIVHSHWASRWKDGHDYGITLQPQKLQIPDNRENEDWFCNVYPKEAFIQAKETFSNLKLDDFITVIFTDGGMHRLGESVDDRKRFLSKSLKSVSENDLSFVFIMGEQERDFREIIEELSIRYAMTNDKEEYNKSFEYLFHLINVIKAKGGG